MIAAGLIARIRSLWRGMRSLDRLDVEAEEEMRFHVELHAERLVREQGLGAREALRQARIAFGSPARYREEGRAARGLQRLGALTLDVKLAGRMLAKYPGVTIVGGLAMAIGVGLGAGYLEVVNDFLHPSVPLAEGDRIVGLRNIDLESSDPEPRSIHDFVAWREQLASVRSVGAFRTIERNVGPTGGAGEPAQGAEISAAAFDVTRVAPRLGRTLLEADEEAGAPLVIVLGHDLWRSRFAADPGIVGRSIQLGSGTGTVVGVMPAGYAFPVSHDFWTPLRAETLLSYERRQGPAIQIFGRLAPGATLDEAQAELSALGRRAEAEYPETHRRLRPQVVKYTELFVGGAGSAQAYLVELFFVLLLLVLGSNVATMVFARTATRENEIVMRFALGASRGQILTQFFIEALVLAVIAAVVGLGVVAWGTGRLTQFVWQITEGEVPFWHDSGLNITTVLYAAVLAVIVSLVAGVLPALRATGAGLRNRIRHSPGGVGSSLRFGGVWSAVIVVQVAFAVLIIPPAIVAVTTMDAARAESGFAEDEYLSARIELEAERPPADAAAHAQLLARFDATRDELRRRLLARPDIAGVTFARQLPGMDHQQWWVEADDAGSAGGLVMSAVVDDQFFDVFGAEVVAGRGFVPGDLRSSDNVVIVNEDFVREVLNGRNAVGRRIRPAGSVAGVWSEIVGVVSDLGMDTDRDAFHSGRGPGVYYPLRLTAAGGAYSLRMAFHVRGDPTALAPDVRAVAHSIDPALRLYDVLPLDRPVDDANRAQRLVARFFTTITALVALIALLISVAGIYSVMSFTVSRQTREIGIRIALGADRRRIITGVFSRAMIQIAIGIIVGAIAWFYVIVYQLGGADRIGLLLATAAILMLVGLAACGVPVRRALRIEPTEALKEVG